MSLAIMVRRSDGYTNLPNAMVNANVNRLQALIRDAGRAISGDFDTSIVNPTGYTTATNAAHIIPFSLYSNQDKEDQARLPSPPLHTLH
jgi:hypothetical protein